jgi:hypothetical protein
MKKLVALERGQFCRKALNGPVWTGQGKGSIAEGHWINVISWSNENQMDILDP